MLRTIILRWALASHLDPEVIREITAREALKVVKTLDADLAEPKLLEGAIVRPTVVLCTSS